MSIDWAILADSLVAGFFGVLVGVGELVSRYRDAPASALKTRSAVLYMALNALAAVVAIGLMKAFGWTFGATDPQALRWMRVLAAGFGSMALFRTSLFTIRAGDQDVGIGPISFLQVVLGATDRAVDRVRARDRANVVKKIMAGIDFDKAYQALPAYAFALMQNLPETDQTLLGRQVGLITKAEMKGEVKTLMLGLALMNLVGEDVLLAAVESLRKDVEKEKQPPPPGPEGGGT
jgi:hypothetical protein